jgi:hypothetical protein
MVLHGIQEHPFGLHILLIVGRQKRCIYRNNLGFLHNVQISFSSNSNAIRSFHGLKFVSPSSLSSNLNPVDILVQLTNNTFPFLFPSKTLAIPTNPCVKVFTLFFDALSTTRSKGGSIAYSENLRPSLAFSDISIRDVWPYIYRRLSGFERILFNLPSDQTLHRGSLHFS